MDRIRNLGWLNGSEKERQFEILIQYHFLLSRVIRFLSLISAFSLPQFMSKSLSILLLFSLFCSTLSDISWNLDIRRRKECECAVEGNTIKAIFGPFSISTHFCQFKIILGFFLLFLYVSQSKMSGWCVALVGVYGILWGESGKGAFNCLRKSTLSSSTRWQDVERLILDSHRRLNEVTFHCFNPILSTNQQQLEMQIQCSTFPLTIISLSWEFYTEQ